MEMLDVYNDNGRKTGKVVGRNTKDENFNEGEHIGVALIYIENDKNEFLIQKTTEKKGGIYSSTGGHVKHGERPIDTIKREVKEELGIDISKEKLINLGHLFVDFPMRFVFYLKKDVDINDIHLKKDEVELVTYMSKTKIKQIIKEGLMHPAHSKILERVLEYKNSN